MSNKKILVPLATLVAAGAVAVGSGATFTSESNNGASVVTSGSLQHTNSKANQAIFQADGLKPGDTVTGGLTITNTGSLPANFGLTETVSSNGFAADHLTLTITNTTTGSQVFSGTFGALQDGDRTALGTIEPGQSNQFTFRVALDEVTPNSEQNKAASATYKWDSVQLAGQDR
jgi:hypothetical protein